MGNPLDDIMASMDKTSFDRGSTPRTTSAPRASVTSTGSFRIPKRESVRDESCLKNDPPTKKPFTPFGVKVESSSSSSTSAAEEFKVFNTLEVQLNSFRLDMSGMPPRLRRFCFETSIVFKDGKKYDLNTNVVAVSGDVNANQRRLAQYQIFEVFFAKHRHLFNNNDSSVAAYDCAATVYVPEKYFTGADQAYKVILVKGDFTADQWDTVRKLARKKEFAFDIKFAPAGFVNTSPQDLLNVANRMEVVRCAEIVTSSNLNNSNFFQYGSATYPVEREQSSRGDPTTWEMKPGFAKVTRIVDGVKGMEMLLTIDPKMSPFYKDGRLLKFIIGRHAEIHGAPFVPSGGGRGGRGRGGHGHGRGDWNRREDSYGRYDNRRESPNNSQNRDFDEPTPEEIAALERAFEAPGMRGNLNSALKGLIVEALHLPKSSNRQIILAGLSEHNAIETVFKRMVNDEEQEISVADYFVEQYSYRLKCPHLPLVYSRKLRQASFFPIEMLSVLPGQRIKANNLTTTIQSAMTGQNAQMPRQQVDLVKKILTDSLRLDQNRHMQVFGLKLETYEPVQMRAKLLAPPQMKFKGNTYIPEPQKVSFKTTFKFVEPAKIKNILIVDFDGAMGSMANDFVRSFEKHCKDCGITFEQDASTWEIKFIRSEDHYMLSREMEQCREEKVSIVLGVHREKRPDAHDYLKYFEEKIGVQTMQICLQTAQKMMSNHGRQTVDNVMRKFNLKCGGLNFTVEIPRSIRGRPFCPSADVAQRKLFEGTQFIGFEISHGSARSLYDRSRGTFDGEPSIVGVSYSLNHSTQLGGFTYMQETREYSLQNLEEKTLQCLKAYQLSTKKLPTKVVVYRVGAGEGDIKKIEQEVKDIRAGFMKIQQGYKPRLVVIVAQKTSHIRVYPARIEGSKPYEQNVPSGTCIDNGITSFGAQEFILVSQAPLIGTIRPVKYTVVANDPHWTKNELCHLTYFRAFGHQVSYGPPAVPDVLYAAENLAKRGKNNWKVHDHCMDLKKTEEEVLKKHPEFDTKEMAEQLTAAIIEKMSDEINGMTLTNHNFWA